jgi:predicted Ser/Thr protein kinase
MPEPKDPTDPADQSPPDPGGANSRSDETPLSGLPTQPATVSSFSGMPGYIGPYRIIAVLGRGGQGTVYRATHPTLGRDVAVKIADGELPEAAQARLFEEGRVLAGLDDPGLIRVYDAGLHDGRPYVAFEYVQGRSLAEKVRGTSLPVPEAVALVAGLAATLERVHRAGILHRDLKPTNVLLDSAGTPRLMDFGSALLTLPYTNTVVEEEYSGTPSYMSPEQANGAVDRVGPASDVFGLAAILYHLVTGSPPYPGTRSREVWEKARTGRVTPAAERNPAIPPALAQILDKALAADPAKRYQSAGAFSRALRSYLRRPLWRVAAVVAGVALVGVAVIAIAQLRKDRDDPRPPPGADPGRVAIEVAPRPRLAGWQQYEPDGAYAVQFPTNPKMIDGKTESKGHPSRQAQSIDPKTGTGFAVTVSPYRDAAPTPQAALRARRDEVLTSINAALTSEREITFDGHHGAEASAFVHAGFFQGYWLRLRIHLVRDQFYMLAVMGRDPHRPDDTEAAWFFDSFRLLKADEKTP